MWKLIITTLFLGSNANTYTSIKPAVTIMVKINSSMCDNPAPIIEPEMCCDFPHFFNQSIIEKCELDFALAEKSAANLVTDSCIIECIFNNSGLASASKIDKVKLMKLVGEKAKIENDWHSLAQVATSTCFGELTDTELAEIAQDIKQEMSAHQKSMKMCNPSASIVLDCMYRELFKVCPNKKLTTTSSECVQLKEYAITCDEW